MSCELSLFRIQMLDFCWWVFTCDVFIMLFLLQSGHENTPISLNNVNFQNLLAAALALHENANANGKSVPLLPQCSIWGFKNDQSINSTYITPHVLRYRPYTDATPGFISRIETLKYQNELYKDSKIFTMDVTKIIN